MSELKTIVSKKVEIRENLLILEDLNALNVSHYENAILLFWVRWSAGFVNCVSTINYLYEQNYIGKILVMDIDIFYEAEQAEQEFGILQKKILGGAFLHGWGEICIIQNGQVIARFGQEYSFPRFKTFFENNLF